MAIIPKFRNKGKPTIQVLPTSPVEKEETPNISDEIAIVDASKLPKSARKVLKIGLEYGGASGRELRFQDPEYDLSEVAAAYDTESYFRRACDKYVEQIWKQGFKIVGKEDKAVRYIRRRLKEIARVTGISTKQLLEDIANQIVPYSNCFIVKKRDPRSSTGNVRITFDGYKLNPVAGYFVLDATSMKIARNIHGTVKKYQQFIQGNPKPKKEFSPIDMIHMHSYRKVGLAAGTPMVTPVLDDIRALRRMEEGIEQLIFQHVIPLLHYKIGTEDQPAIDDEIQALKTTVQDMPSNGVIVTPERHEIQAIGAEGRSIRAEGYLNYFKQRVWAGLGMSGVSFGEGDTANRSTALTMDANLQDTSRKFQQIIKQFFDEEIVDELLLEGGFDLDDEAEDRLVELFIPEIDLDTKTKIEAHNLLQYEGNAISHKELREAMGRDPMSDEEWKLTNWELVEKPKALIMAVDETSPFTKSEIKTTPSKATSNAAQPQNQYGKKVGTKPPINANAEICDTAKSYVDYQLEIQDETTISIESQTLLERLNYSICAQTIKNRYNMLRDATAEIGINSNNDKELAISKSAALLGFTDDTMTFILSAIQYGINDFAIDSELQPYIKNEASIINSLRTQINNSYSKLITDLYNRLKIEPDSTYVIATFDTLEFRIDFNVRTSLMRAYNLGYALAARDSEIEELDVISETDTDHTCSSHGKVVNLKNFDMERLPPFHVNCVCRLKTRSK